MLQEGQQLSHYRLAGLLKSGGMGEVYLAVDTLLHRQVAIKVIRTDSSRHTEANAAKESARLFLREAQAIAQLDQINILPLYDSGEEHVNGTTLMYMVMPFREAGSLKDWLRTHFGEGLLPLAAVERIVSQAAFALQHAHDRQIVHQDVKPSNFLVHGDAEHPSRLNLQLADFGVAKFMMKTSESQVVRGTPVYMAPEQWEGHPVPATDQYALAVMAYELLTGRPPFEGSGYQNLWHQHCHVDPIPPSMINPALPKELDAVLLRALAKKPENRYSSVSAFAHAFQRAVLNSGNIYQTVMISALEARTGTNRVITLPTGRQVALPIPPGVYHGQVIRLEGYGRPTTYNSPVGAIIVTIVVANVEKGIPRTTATFQQTAPVPAPLVKHDVKPAPPRKRHNRGVAMLSITFVLVLLAGCMGFYYVTSSSPGAQTATITSYPSYIPGHIGTVALYDPLKDDSKGYVWNPPGYPYCYFNRDTLHVWVYGDTINPVHFHPCIGKTPFYRDFAFQIKMTFIKGDCGGVVFRSHEPMLYYFYICQDGQYGLVRYTENKSDPSINPTLREGFSKFILTGTGQANIIAVVAQGSNIGLYVNQQHIDSAQDANYRDGTIGVLAKIFTTGMTEVAFSDATVWTF